MSRKKKLNDFIDGIEAVAVASWGSNPVITRYMVQGGRQFLVEEYSSGGWEIYTTACQSNKIDETPEAARNDLLGGGPVELTRKQAIKTRMALQYLQEVEKFGLEKHPDSSIGKNADIAEQIEKVISPQI